MERLQILGTEVFVDIKGEGEPIVILHGWGASSATMRSISDFLSKKYKTIAVDFPGFGKSPPPPFAWTVSEYAQMVGELLTELDIESPVMLGHSFGGSVIIEAAYQELFLMKKIVLVGSAGIKRAPTLEGIKKGKKLKVAKRVAELLPFGMGEQLVENMRNKMGSEDYRAASGVMREILVKKVNYDQTEQLSKIHTETLLMWGENDTATPLADGEAMRDLMPNAGLAIIKNAGHFSFLDNPSQFFAVLGTYL